MSLSTRKFFTRKPSMLAIRTTPCLQEMSESRKQPVLIFHDSLRSPCPIQQLFEVDLYCRVLEGRLVLRERAANVSWLAGEAVLFLANGKDVFVRLMEGEIGRAH